MRPFVLAIATVICFGLGGCATGGYNPLAEAFSVNVGTLDTETGTLKPDVPVWQPAMALFKAQPKPEKAKEKPIMALGGPFD